ncbi:MAG TPA: tRNA lysidine(34) synthetase TilS [Actinomycetota bacterium]|nr:tRNA lysidine(34) synthetase TilS [Actinomycetota bacterium]
MGREGRGDLMRRPPAVARVLERVTRTAREHEMFAPGDRVLVSVSGGPDSVCLLYSLWHLRRLFKIELEVFHFDHRLRPDSAKDGEYVRRLAERIGLPFNLRDANDAPLRGESIEAWGRTARSMSARVVAAERGARCVAQGHTRDDQAETILMALLSAGNLHSLVGIRPRLGLEVQPLLDVTRDEVESFCGASRLRPRRDPTNLDTRLLRNAIRLEGIPALERATGREVKGPIARTGDLLRPIEDEWIKIAGSALPREELGSPLGPDGFRFNTRGLASLSRAVAVDVIRYVLYSIEVPATQETIEAILDLAEGRPGRRRDLPAGLKARREREYVSVSRTSPESRV